MRTLSVTFACFVATMFFTSTCNAQLSEVLLLTLSSDAKSDQTAVRFLVDATDSFDSQYDAYKMMNPDPTPNIYTVSDQDYAINALNNDFSKKLVALHVRASCSAIYTLKAEEIGAFGPSWSIQLTDLLLNQVIDFRKVTSYSFMASPTDHYHRFSLTFTQPNVSLLLTGDATPHQKDIDHVIYTHQDKIIVSADDEVVSAIRINDLEGNNVCTTETPSATWSFSPDKTGIYIVHLSTDQHHYTKKVLIYKN